VLRSAEVQPLFWDLCDVYHVIMLSCYMLPILSPPTEYTKTPTALHYTITITILYCTVLQVQACSLAVL